MSILVGFGWRISLGNAEADAPADLGRHHQSEVIINGWRRLLKVRSYLYPIMLDLHRVYDCCCLGNCQS